MAFYITIQEIIEVHKWTKYGSHPNDLVINGLNEAKIVKRFGKVAYCSKCYETNIEHGLLTDSQGLEQIVCPGDFIRTVRNDVGFIIGYDLMTGETIKLKYEPFTKQDIEE